MRIRLAAISIGVWILLASGGLFADAQRITLTSAGRSRCVILLAHDATAPMRHGAEEIAAHIAQMSGAAPPILDSTSDPGAWPKGTGAAISIADDAAAAAIEQRPGLSSEAFRIRTRRAHGPIDVPTIEITGDNRRGALYGCYGFLEDVLGCRWYTNRISHVPKRRSITVGPLDILEKPAFEYREPFFLEPLDRDWCVRNRTNGSTEKLDDSVGGQVTYGAFVHTFNKLVPPEEYYDAHPEYFSLINGRRMKGYYQLCLTNPDVLKITITKVREWIKAHPDATIFSVSQNDTFYNCQCDRCKAVEREEGSPAGVLLRFVNAVADAIAPDYPHVLIDTLAYQWSEDPPKLVRPHPNVRIRLAPIGACMGHGIAQCDANRHEYEILKSWSKITNQLYIWQYSTNFHHYFAPLPDLDEIAADIPLYKRNGVAGVFYEGDYAKGGGGEMADLKAYLLAKLMWNPDRPVKPIITDFLNGVYGKGAPYLQKWLDLIHSEVRTHNRHVHIFDSIYAPYITPAILAEGTKVFDAAERATASDPGAHDEVQRARLGLEYEQFMRSSPHYVLQGAVYRPVEGGDHAVLLATVVDKVRRYGYGAIREWETVDEGLKRLQQPDQTYTVLTLENASLRLDVVPGLGGRILRLIDKQSGKEFLRESSEREQDYPLAGGYEEYVGEPYHSLGWTETYAGTKALVPLPYRGTTEQIQVSTRLANGLKIERSYALDGPSLRIETTVTNTGTAARSVTLHSHPEFALSGGEPRVIYTDRAGNSVDRALDVSSPEMFLTDMQLPNGTFRLDLGAARVTVEFYPDSVGKLLLYDARRAGHVNAEIYGISGVLAPGQITHLDQVWHIEGGGSRKRTGALSNNW